MSDEDASYILVEFINESNNMAVGYFEWLENVDIEDLKKIIEDESFVTIKWPKCDIAPKNKVMSKKLQQVEWSKFVVKILSRGDWINLTEQLKNIEKYNALNPSKAERKILKRKLTDNEDFIEPTKKSNSKKANKETSVTRNKTDVIAKFDANFSKDSDPYEAESSSSEYEDSSYNNLSKSALITKIKILQTDNKHLRTEIARLRLVNNDVPTITKLSRTLLENVNLIHLKIMEITKITSETKENNFKETLKKDEEQKDEKLPEIDIVDDSSDDAIADSNDAKHENNVRDTLARNDINPANNSVKMLQQMLEKDVLDKCNRKTPSKLTCDLMKLMFTKQEMANCSLTGTVPNTHLKKGVEAKNKIDGEKVKLIEDYVAHQFPSPSYANLKNEIQKAMKQKLNNVSKEFKKTK